MNPLINFVEFENRVISATYRNLMIGAKVLLVQKSSGEPLLEPVTMITSPTPSGTLRISLPASVKAGDYFLRALNGHGEFAAQSVEFQVG
jgi:2-keto-4-pentenoate hydratase/2-oxohepta-3-ene-1,7-dioic acid hydratase in catechol pathway